MNGIFYLVGLIVVALLVTYALGEKAYEAALLFVLGSRRSFVVCPALLWQFPAGGVG
jgi:hypothetical protein